MVMGTDLPFARKSPMARDDVGAAHRTSDSASRIGVLLVVTVDAMTRGDTWKYVATKVKKQVTMDPSQ